MALLTSTDEVIEVFGGSRGVAELCEVTPSTVWTWNYRKKFPAARYRLMRRALKARGHDAPPQLWGQQRP